MKLFISILLLMIYSNLNAQVFIDYDRIVEKDRSVIMKGSFMIKNLKEANYTWFKTNYEKAKLSDDNINILKDRLNDIRIIIFLGTWCSDTHALIPPFIKLLDKIEYPIEKLQLYGVDRKKETKGIEHRLYHIEKVPTIILMRDNNEVGRITEYVEKNIQTTLMQLLQKI
jgi:hypothetical protein